MPGDQEIRHRRANPRKNNISGITWKPCKTNGNPWFPPGQEKKQALESDGYSGTPENLRETNKLYENVWFSVGFLLFFHCFST